MAIYINYELQQSSRKNAKNIQWLNVSIIRSSLRATLFTSPSVTWFSLNIVFKVDLYNKILLNIFLMLNLNNKMLLTDKFMSRTFFMFRVKNQVWRMILQCQEVTSRNSFFYANSIRPFWNISNLGIICNKIKMINWNHK